MRAELRRALTTRHRPVHNHARAKVAPACARPSRRPPAQKMHAGKKDVKHTLLFILGASGDEESPISRRSPEALWRGAGVRPPPRPRTPSQREVRRPVQLACRMHTLRARTRTHALRAHTLSAHARTHALARPPREGHPALPRLLCTRPPHARHPTHCAQAFMRLPMRC